MAQLYDISYLEKDYKRQSQQGPRVRHGQRWTQSDLNTLAAFYKSGHPLEQLCNLLERPAAGILPKLVSLGMLEKIGDDYYVVITYETRSQKVFPKILFDDCFDSAHSGFHFLSDKPVQQENIMTQDIKNIETRTYIQGQDASKLTDAQLFDIIAKLEKDKRGLSLIENKSKKLQAAIDAIANDIAAINTYIDSRE